MLRLKRIITALILLIIISIPCLIFVYYQSAQWMIRHEMEEKLEQQHLQTLRVPVTEVNWYKKNKEIIVEGRLFDVKSATPVHGVIIFTGLYDAEETEIKNKLRDLQNKKNKDGDSQVAKKFISILLFADEKLTHLFKSVDIPAIRYTNYNKDNLITADIAIPSPPPKA